MWGIGLPAEGESPSLAIYAVGFVMYVALAFVTIFFNAAVIGTAMKRLQGEDAKISDGLALARQHIGKIFVWAVVTATVGMILRTLQERAGIVGRILLGIVGIAWTVLTYFVVPVLLFEPAGVGEAIKRSGSIFRQRWGEQFIGQATIGLAFFLLSIPVVLVGVLLSAAVPILGVPLLIIAIGVLMAIAAACSGVFNAALYRYATTGEASGAFSMEDMNSSFRPRKDGRGVGPAGFTGGGFGGGSTLPPAPDDSPDRPDL
jgi:hypothetical protein